MRKVIRPTQNRKDFASEIGAPLDLAQLKRIESVHRGFLYQHLYAVACLLTCARQPGNALTVERDEDVEFATPSQRTYIQVKTRSRTLQLGDIAAALDGFEALRLEHLEGRRSGAGAFAIISNAEPGPELAAMLNSDAWPDGVGVISPQRAGNCLLPPAWTNLEAAIHWCINAALEVPFGTLVPETLVWKLAARVQYAAAGRAIIASRRTKYRHCLSSCCSAQDFPDPPAGYRPQIDEPPLMTEERLRLLTGFSGAGKTAWASQAALHCPSSIAYYDVGEIPSASVASALARELVARFGGGRPSWRWRRSLSGICRARCFARKRGAFAARRPGRNGRSGQCAPHERPGYQKHCRGGPELAVSPDGATMGRESNRGSKLRYPG